ncbi:MAG TPA: GNAT family N-acetyltransferase [archaeon]|nr:GNAT family N-acetyltransferase [archaeon]
MITELTGKDLKSASKLLVDYWNSRGMSQYTNGYARKYLSQGHAKEIKFDKFFVLKSATQDAVAVVSLIVYDGDVAEIRDFVVDKKYRGKGYGRKIVEELIEKAKKLKVRKLFSLASDKNTGFYKHLGFKKEGVLKDHFSKGEDLTIFSKFL